MRHIDERRKGLDTLFEKIKTKEDAEKFINHPNPIIKRRCKSILEGTHLTKNIILAESYLED